MSAGWYAVVLSLVALAVLVAGAWFVLYELRTRTSPPPAWSLWLGYLIVAVLVVYGTARTAYMVFQMGTRPLSITGEPMGITWKGILEIVVIVAVGVGVLLSGRVRSLADGAGLLARLYVGYIFIDAGWAKLGHVGTLPGTEFRQTVWNFQVLPFGWQDLVAHALPVVELAAGVFVVVGLFTRTTSTVISMLLCVFLVAVTGVWVRGIAISCGCTGGRAGLVHPDYLQHLFRDGGYLVLSTFLIVKRNTLYALDDLLFGKSA